MSEQANDTVELESEAEAETPETGGKAEASEVATVEATEEAARGGVDQPDGDSDSSDVGANAPDRIRYASGLDEAGMRRVILDVNYRNRGRVGYEADDQAFLEKYMTHPDVVLARSPNAISAAIMTDVASGPKSGHPQGR